MRSRPMVRCERERGGDMVVRGNARRTVSAGRARRHDGAAPEQDPEPFRFTGIKSVLGSGARHGLDAYQAIRQTLCGPSILDPG
jgi:hypothetical protein